MTTRWLSDLRVYAQPHVARMLLLGFSGDWEAVM
jgi:hypothetical protein